MIDDENKRLNLIGEVENAPEGEHPWNPNYPGNWKDIVKDVIVKLKKEHKLKVSFSYVKGVKKGKVKTGENEDELRVIEAYYRSKNKTIYIFAGSILYRVLKELPSFTERAIPEQKLFESVIADVVAHEYCHALQHNRGENMDTSDNIYDEDELEKEANQFGINFAKKYVRK
ncbi:ImmA/IrrE family metallo-endopeptidase [Bacillus sp. S3]|uniref:ImmA/IrrE family metallo-endopeptidase n=1 Tax=Bacillus sp. S3 TaxID=486398 RepID=UPI00118C8C11|nr:ImmA/IrrE family metallo-endopeptidase [Bacillus sp. S3]QCJ40617.1 ImmA/IrrE family metallo-endopeptidase [Bacillus sp. S3]